MSLEAAQMLETIPGLTARRLDHWTRLGYLKPEDQAHSGTGHRRTWPAVEVEVCRVMVQLVDAGLTLPAAHTVARGEPVLAPGVWVLLPDIQDAA
jgi:DNA-binding transcriptional MerR regulator